MARNEFFTHRSVHFKNQAINLNLNALLRCKEGRTQILKYQVLLCFCVVITVKYMSWIYKLKRTVRLTGPILSGNEGLFSSR